jgi:hypothetical protein
MKQRLIGTAWLVLAPLAWAQTTPPAAPPAGPASPASSAAPAVSSSPAKKELVTRILAMQQPGIESMARNLAEQPIVRLAQAAGQTVQTKIPPEKREATAKAVDAEIRKYLDDAVPLLRERAVQLGPATIGTQLEEKFSEDELRQLLAWLESPVNKKYQQAAPELQNALVMRLVSENRATIEPKLKDLEQRVAAVLGVPSQSATPAAKASGPGATGKPAAAKPAPSRPAASAAAPRPAASAASR